MDKSINRYNNLEDIIKALNPDSIGNSGTYVGKNYTKEALIMDLRDIINTVSELDNA